LKQLRGFTASGSDGDVGRVEDLLFDDERWTVRYLAVEMGGLLDRRQVLVSPISFESVDWPAQRFRLKLTKEQVVSSPNIDADEPVSRQREAELNRHYGYPYYWGSTGIWGSGFYPGMLLPPPLAAPLPERILAPTERPESATDTHLRSAQHVTGYQIQGRDDAIGHVEDFMIDDESWQIRYLIVDTSKWWFGKKVLLSPEWVERVSWEDRQVDVDLPREAIKEGPAWDPAERLDAAYEAGLQEYYARAQRAGVRPA
jgi:sporulation protein YlmC with PRC-barrel domain